VKAYVYRKSVPEATPSKEWGNPKSVGLSSPPIRLLRAMTAGLRACRKNRRAVGLRARRAGWRGATREHIREKSVTKEQQRRPASPAARPPGILFRYALGRLLNGRCFLRRPGIEVQKMTDRECPLQRSRQVAGRLMGNNGPVL